MRRYPYPPFNILSLQRADLTYTEAQNGFLHTISKAHVADQRIYDRERPKSLTQPRCHHAIPKTRTPRERIRQSEDKYPGRPQQALRQRQIMANLQSAHYVKCIWVSGRSNISSPLRAVDVRKNSDSFPSAKSQIRERSF